MTISGTGMMLKSLGIDPEEIKKNAEVFMEQMKLAIAEVKKNQLTLESKCDLILTNQQHFNLLIGGLIEAGTTVKLQDEEGKDLGIISTSEKFPQEVLDAANSGGEISGENVQSKNQE
jgi:hypothetical protein